MKRNLLTLLVFVLCGSPIYAQSKMEKTLEEKYGWACEQTSDGRRWYNVRQNGLYGACDEKGKLLVPLEYDGVSLDYEDGYITAVKDKKTTVFDIKGKVLMRTDFEEVRWYQMKDDGFCEVKKDGKWGAINKKGEIVIPCEYDKTKCYQFEDEDYCEVKKDEKWGVIDKKGTMVVPCEYDELRTYGIKEYGFCEVKLGGEMGVYSVAEKRELVPCLYDNIEVFSDARIDGVFKVIRNDCYGVSNDKGQEIIPCQYSYLAFNSDGTYAIVAKGGTRPADAAPRTNDLWCKPDNAQWGVVDRNGKEVVPFDFGHISHLTGDVAIVENGGHMEYKKISSYMMEGKQFVYYSCPYKGGKNGFFNMRTGKCSECIFGDYAIGEGYVACCNAQGKWGYLDAETMLEAVPFMYEKATEFKDGVAQVKQNGTTTFLTDPKKGTSLRLAGGAKIKVDSDIPVSSEKQEETFAFIIANENYVHLKGADYAINDGKIFRDYCLKTFGMPESNVRYYEDATYGNLVNAVHKIKDITDVYEGDAKIIIYFSGLGMTDATTQERYLMPVDASVGALNVTAYSVTKMMETLNGLNTQQTIVILDAPFSGSDKEGKMMAENRGVAIKSKATTPQGNTLLCLSCSDGEAAYSSKDYGHGLFTYALLEKIQESKGRCSIKEAMEYATTWVKKEALKKYDKVQSPTIQVSDALNTKMSNIKF